MNIERIFKMKNKKMVLGIALMVMAIVPVYAQQYNSESDFQIDWDPNVNGGVVITNYTGTRREVSIPPRIQNNPVTGIRGAFVDNNNITSVTIPNGVTSIKGVHFRGAFSGCTSLTRITIPNGVTSIEWETFKNCRSLTSITIPNSVTSIGQAAFQNCTSLTSITIPNGVTSIEAGTFENCTSLTSVTIPNSVTSINGGISGGRYIGAFMRCTSLKSVTIPSSVTSIGDGAFFECTSLASVTIPNSVTTIGDIAFANCTSLTSVTIPSSVISIGNDAFTGINNLTSVTFEGVITKRNFGATYGNTLPFPGDLQDKYFASDGGPGVYSRFAGGEVWRKTQSITPPPQPAAVPAPAAAPAAATPAEEFFFFELFRRTSYSLARSTAQGAVVIPDTYNNLPVTRIDEGAFVENNNITSVTIPSSVTYIGYLAFFRCDNLTSVTFQGASVNSINFDRSAFPGDLRAKYLAKNGGAGTYTRPNGTSTTWTKQ